MESTLTCDARSFERDATDVFSDVRKSLADWVAAIPGDLQRPIDLQRTLELDSKICWQIFNVIRGEQALAATRHIPTLPALKRALAAGERSGVSRDLSSAVRRSIEAFERVVEFHAGNRSDFDAMAAALARDDGAGQIELRQRRSVYRGLSQIWGMQVDCFNAITLVRRAASGNATDQVMISRKRGMRRLRPDAHIDVFGWRISVPSENPPNEMQPLDPDSAMRCGAPLLPQFCSQPEPTFERIDDRDGWVRLELADNEIGRHSEVDLAFGTRVNGVPLPRDTDDRPWFGANILSTTPTALIINDLLVHRPSFGRVTPELIVFPNVPGTDAPSVMRRMALPLSERVSSLGRGSDLSQTPDLPGYPDMLDYSARETGWDLSEFDAFRVRIEYPIMHAVMRLFFYSAAK